MQKNIQKQILYDLFQAYYDARKNKRNTLNQLNFEYNLEGNIIKLWEELISWKYQVWRSIYFIQKHPIKREVFAWDFRDRVVHHLVYNYISPIFEKDFIYDSYSCRVWKWTSFGIKRISKFIRSCSENYTKDCYILKLDISGYFMSIDKDILFDNVKNKIICNLDNMSSWTWFRINKMIKSNYNPEINSGWQQETIQGRFPSSQERQWENFFNFLINLIQKIIFNNPTKNSIFKWKKSDYIWLPKNKSLFFAKENCWLPIWNLTSQLFSNIYLSDFDKYIKQELRCKYYGRYVDDFIIIHKDKDFLVSIIPKISSYLKENLWLTLHPKKICLQHYTKWVLFLWVFIKPYRIYIRKRTIWYFYQKVQKLNNQIIDNKLKTDFRSIINSYLGMMKHYKSYKIRKKILLNQVSSNFWNIFYVSNWWSKVCRKINKNV